MIDSENYYHDEKFEGLAWSGKGLRSIEFEGCHFTNCQLAEAQLLDCHFRECVFIECNLSLMRIPGTKFQQTEFQDSKLFGINWAAADWSMAAFNNPFQFSDCALNHCVFIGLELPGLLMIDCSCHEMDFRGSKLTGASFSGTDFAGTQFQETDLSRADFSQARNYQIAPLDNKLTGARFSLPEAMALLDGLDI